MLFRSVHINPQAQALGLPKKGDAQYGNEGAIAFHIRTIQVINSEPGQEFCFVRVLYRPVNWDIGAYMGGSIEDVPNYTFYLPIIYNLSSLGGASLWIRNDLRWERGATMRTETRQGGTLDEYQRLRDRNKNKLYELDGMLYRLHDVVARADRGNNVRSNTYFLRTGYVREFAARSFEGASLALPELQPLEDYDQQRTADGGYSTNAKKEIPTMYRPGEVLPWL